MTIHALHRRLFSCLVAAALLMRVAIPTGYMPAQIDGGWFLQLCPDNMPAHVMQALFGEHHAHHGSGSDSTFFQCGYDSGVTSDAVVQAQFTCAAEAFDSAWARVPGTSVAKRLRFAAFQSRAPPFTSVSFS